MLIPHKSLRPNIILLKLILDHSLFWKFSEPLEIANPVLQIFLTCTTYIMYNVSGFVNTLLLHLFIFYDNIYVAHMVTLSVEDLCSMSMFIVSGVFLSAIEYIIYLHQQKKKQEEELEALRKEVMALKIMKT